MGDAHALKVENDYPTPTLKPGQVIVKNEYAGINFIDTYHRKGLYPRDLPFVGGQEGGGTVAAVSDEAASQGIKVGDPVAYSVFGSCELGKKMNPSNGRRAVGIEPASRFDASRTARHSSLISPPPPPLPFISQMRSTRPCRRRSSCRCRRALASTLPPPASFRA